MNQASTNLGVDQLLKTCLNPPENVVKLEPENSIDLQLNTPNQ
jgi:hypothetical protein